MHGHGAEGEGKQEESREKSRKQESDWLFICDPEGSILTLGRAKSSLVLMPSWLQSQREFSHSPWSELVSNPWGRACSHGTSVAFPALAVPVGQQGVGHWDRAVCPQQPGQGQHSTWHLPHIGCSVSQRCCHCQDNLHQICTLLCHCFAFFWPEV